MNDERILIVAPSWVGDAILSEPLIALLRERSKGTIVDVLAPRWCGPVYARMRGLRRVIDNPFGHGKLDLQRRGALAHELRSLPGSERYTRAYVLPNSWKSALVPFLAGIPLRIGYRGEMRFGLVNDARPLPRKAMPRLVDRFAALAVDRGMPLPPVPAPVLVPDLVNRAAALSALGLDTTAPIAMLCPGAEYGPAKRWPSEHFAALATRLLADGHAVWLIGSPNDQSAAAAVIRDANEAGRALVDLTGRTDIGTAIDLLSLARVVISNDSGLMHAAAALGVPLVALFGSSSTAYTPPLSPTATIARIDIACSPCFKRECPLGHFKCMRDLAPEAVYDLARKLPSPARD